MSPMGNANRAVITGIGAIHPFGNGWETLWENILQGKSAIRNISRFDTSCVSCPVAAEIPNFDINQYMPGRKVRKYDLCTQFTVASLEHAINDSGIKIDDSLRNKIGLIIGNSCGGPGIFFTEIKAFLEKGEKNIHPLAIPLTMNNNPSAVCAQLFNISGMNLTISTACSSGLNAIGMAYNMIRSGKYPVVITGGCDAPIVPHLVAAFGSLGALAKEIEGNISCYPFDKRRNGFVLGEGSVLMVLESLQSAINRGATIYSEVLGFASTCDVSHLVIPDSSGKEAARVMTEALIDSMVSHEKIEYIHAHGTGTQINDVVETRAIKKVFGNRAKQILINSSKGAVGHMLGGAGALGAAVASLVIKTGMIPPTANLRVFDDECDLDYVPFESRMKKVEYAMVNSIGLGGNNSCLILGSIHRKPNKKTIGVL